ncbi:MAG: copper oxidase, partial [Austwickia sp.]|nr:copper oxidase [Austwickia sp.]
MTRPDSRAWPLRDYPVLLWLALAGVVALVHRYLPEARWLMVHLVVLGALTHAIVVWSTHFTQALLKTPAHLDVRRTQSRRLGLLILGAAAVIVGVPTGWWGLVVAGAVGLATAVGWHAWALARRLRAALPGRFRVTVRYYLAAAAALPIGATFGAWLAHGVDAQTRGRLLMAHTMTMALGWVGLTVAGTLLTLWPTMLRTR